MAPVTHAARPRRPQNDSPALVIIDMINDFDFEDGEVMGQRAAERAPVIGRLAAALRACEVPIIYANDNFGRWRSSLSELTDHCRKTSRHAAAILDELAPQEQDYLVLKPRHSAFFGTPLEILLDQLGIGHLILAGITTEYCVHFTAVEAYFRNYQLTVVRDGTAGVTQEAHDRSLELMDQVLKATVVPASEIELR